MVFHVFVMEIDIKYLTLYSIISVVYAVSARLRDMPLPIGQCFVTDIKSCNKKDDSQLRRAATTTGSNTS